jgi:hypothetical protein
MEVFVPLMVAAIQSAGQILASVASKAKDVADKYIFDKKFVESTVIDSAEQLANLMNVTSLDLKQELIEHSIMDVIQELQAHVASLGELLSLVKTSEITPVMAERLITGELLPLRVSLKKAELRLAQHGREDVRLFCHVVGTNTLIAGYMFAGQDVPTLKKDLEDSIYVFQKRLLDAIAETDYEIPWSKVPHLLTVDGISDLFELYLRSNNKKPLVGESQAVKPEEPTIKPKPSSKVESKSIEKSSLQDVVGRARILHDFLSITFTCSECGFKVYIDAETCPRCKRKFVY